MRSPRSSLLVTYIGLLSAVTCAALAVPRGTVQSLAGVLDSRITDLPGRPFALHLAPDGTLFVTQQDLARVSLVRTVGSGGRGALSVGTDPGDVLVTPDGEVAIVSTFIDGDLHFLDAATGTQTDFTPIGPNAYRLSLSKSGKDVFVTTTGGEVHRVSVATGDLVESAMLGGTLQGIALSPEGDLAVASSGGRIALLDPATLGVITSRIIGGRPQDIAFSRGGSHLYVAQEGAARVLVLDALTLAPVDSVYLGDAIPLSPFGLALSPDGATLVVASAYPGALAVLDARTLRVVSRIGLAGTPRRVVFDASGRRAYVANEAGYVDVVR